MFLYQDRWQKEAVWLKRDICIISFLYLKFARRYKTLQCRGPFDALKCAPVYKSSKTKVFKPASLCSRGLFLPHTYHSVSRFIEVILSDRNLHLNIKKRSKLKRAAWWCCGYCYWVTAKRLGAFCVGFFCSSNAWGFLPQRNAFFRLTANYWL